MLLRKLENIPARFSGPNPGPIFTKLRNFLNLVKKQKKNKKKKKLRNENFAMAPVPEENDQHTKSST